LIYQTKSDMKTTTLTIIQDADGRNLKAFKAAADRMAMIFNIVSPSDAVILDISIQYNSEDQLFVLGQLFNLFKTK
jgi:hypothetical protein